MGKKDKGGKIYLVGAGPGNPGLITISGAEALSRADVVIYDYLVDSQILSRVRGGAKLIYVGKKGGDHTISQEEINELLIKEAKDGNIVVRLKGGDPFIFGRGGEEALRLSEGGIDFEVIPGVTSAIAVPAFAGIPVTHRHYTSTVAFITGHEDPTKNSEEIDWEYLAHFPGTLVVLMGVRRIGDNVRRLIAGGKPPDTPVAVISWGTTPRQQGVYGSLSDIVELVEEEGVIAPAVMVIGDVVSLRDSLSWFEKLPLFGKKIIVTRTRHQARELSGPLRVLGAQAIELPTIEIAPTDKPEEIGRVIRSITDYEVIVLTSPNGVKTFFDGLSEAGLDTRSLGGIIVSAMGPGTAGALGEFGVIPDIVPDRYIAEELAECIISGVEGGVSGKKIVLIRAEGAREILPDLLRKAGADVEDVGAYRSILPDIDVDELEDVIPGADLVTFTSSSTAKNFGQLMGNEKMGSNDHRKLPKAAVIGPITAESAREAGFDVVIEATKYTIPGLIDAIVKYYQGVR